ncbi:MAG: lysozyme inhibitor LprI family protein, partial [Phenylobacterium sp.]
EIEGASQAQAAQEAAAAAETAKQTEAAQKADLEMATAENKLANQQINTIWKSLPEEARSQLLELQRAWVRKKTADCNIEAAGVSTEAMPKEAARLRCDTRLTMERISELQSIME